MSFDTVSVIIMLAFFACSSHTHTHTHTQVTPGVPGVKPVEIELTDKNTKEVVDVLEVDACLVATGRKPYTTGLRLKNVGVATDRRGFIPVNNKMQVLDDKGFALPNIYCIGDANGIMMLAHAASAQVGWLLHLCLEKKKDIHPNKQKTKAVSGTYESTFFFLSYANGVPQGISVIENIQNRENILNHNSVPAACFTHPEISFCGLSEADARKVGEEEGFPVAVAKTSFKANSKALSELESDGKGWMGFLRFYRVSLLSR